MARKRSSRRLGFLTRKVQKIARRETGFHVWGKVFYFLAFPGVTYVQMGGDDVVAVVGWRTGQVLSLTIRTGLISQLSPLVLLQQKLPRTYVVGPSAIPYDELVAEHGTDDEKRLYEERKRSEA